MEEWKDIPCCDGWQVSSEGRLRNLYTQKYKKVVPKNTKYVTVALKTQDGTYSFALHRLVADAFIPNPDELPVVNHKDLDTHNNCVDNLEWVSFSDNTKHAMAYYGPFCKCRQDD